jgi:hypothetical protein
VWALFVNKHQPSGASVVSTDLSVTTNRNRDVIKMAKMCS